MDCITNNEKRFLGHINDFAKTKIADEQMTELVVCMGPMFSGKTTLLYKSFMMLQKYNELDVLVVNHSNDIRESDDVISSHNNDITGKIKCIKTDHLNCDKLLEFISQKDKSIVLLIDEIQFFADLYTFIKDVFTRFSDKQLFIGCFGLNSNFMRDIMGDVSKILHYAKDIIVLRGSCSYCRKPSLCSYLKQFNGNEDTNIVIGGSDKYIPLCHHCYTLNI